MNLFHPDKRGLCFMQKNKGGVLHQKERGFALLSGLLLIRDVSINIPFSSTPVSSTAIHNSQSPSALHLSAQKVLIQARESCERLLRILKVLKCGIHFFSGLKNPNFCNKKTLYSPSNLALSGAPSVAGSFQHKKSKDKSEQELTYYLKNLIFVLRKSVSLNLLLCNKLHLKAIAFENTLLNFEITVIMQLQSVNAPVWEEAQQQLLMRT